MGFANVRKKYLVFIAILLVGAAIFLFFLLRKSPLIGGLTTPSPVASAAINATPLVTNTIEIKDSSFRPPLLKVQKGERVTWINRDTVPHTVTATILGGQHIIPPGTSLTLDTDNVFLNGEVTYKCDFHSHMFGTLAVYRDEKAATNSPFAKFLRNLPENQRICIEQSIPAERLFGLKEGYILTQNRDEQAAIDRCLKVQ